jgi:hypothetical protein
MALMARPRAGENASALGYYLGKPMSVVGAAFGDDYEQERLQPGYCG